LDLEQLNPVLSNLSTSRKKDWPKKWLLSYGETSFSIVCQVVTRIAEFAKDYELHYANLTEYVAETENKDFGKRCHNWFHIANRPCTRLHRLTRKRTFQQFCTDFKVDSVTNLESGCTCKHAVAPHYYGFTWVRSSHLKDTIVLRDYVKLQFPHYQKEQPL
jgi:hypothetical protein